MDGFLNARGGGGWVAVSLYRGSVGRVKWVELWAKLSGATPLFGPVSAVVAVAEEQGERGPVVVQLFRNFGFLEHLAKHDSMFQKSPFLARPVGRQPAKQDSFVRLVFQKPANSRLTGKFQKSPPSWYRDR